MTICPGGLTQAKAGVAAFVNYGSGAAGLLAAVPRLSPLAAASYALSGVSIATSVLCGSEPPAMPTFTQDEINDLINNNFFDTSYTTALGKLKDMISNLAWYQLCECQSGGAVTLPTPPVQPTPPVVSPTDIPNTTVQCAHFTTGPVTWASFGNGKVNSNPSVITDVAGAFGLDFTINVVLTGGGTPAASTGTVDAFNHSGQHKQIDTITLGTSGTFHNTYLVDPLWPSIKFSLLPTGVGSPTGQTLEFIGTLTCSGSAAVGPANCCPPDPLVVAKLDNIQALVTLLQRQLAPFAYVPGTVHTGLSGTGVLSVQGLLGAKITITTDPTTLGVEGTSPPILFDRGYITWGTADGYPQSERLERTSQLSLPARASAFTDLAYDLHPGVVVTITELVREP